MKEGGIRSFVFCFFFQAEDGIRDGHVTGVQTCALPIFAPDEPRSSRDDDDQASSCRSFGTSATRPSMVSSERRQAPRRGGRNLRGACLRPEDTIEGLVADVPKLRDRKSTRLDSSHVAPSSAVFS